MRWNYLEQEHNSGVNSPTVPCVLPGAEWLWWAHTNLGPADLQWTSFDAASPLSGANGWEAAAGAVLGQPQGEGSTIPALILPLSRHPLRPEYSPVPEHASRAYHIYPGPAQGSAKVSDAVLPGYWQGLLQLINGVMWANEGFLPNLLELRKSDTCSSGTLLFILWFSYWWVLLSYRL